MLDLRAAAIAANRFGFGSGHGELAAIAPDPRGWLKDQLRPGPAPQAGAPSAQRLAEFLQARKDRKIDIDPAQMLQAKMFQKELRADFNSDAAERTLAAAASVVPFRERLVQFWSNHFTVSIQRPVVIPVAIGFENEAIRPHVTGRFRDMLLAVAWHPAMLLYLDNAQSVGPNSVAGRLKDRGLNENLAREMLELHSVGVDGGYTQSDVTEFAKILTGWSIARPGEPDAGKFRYRPMIHEPGEKRLMGRLYREGGEDEAVAAMTDLAARPQTARHLAVALARHFVADDPPQKAVDALADAYQRSDGDLAAVSLALVDLPQIWSEPLGKVKTPNDLVISACRMFGSGEANFGGANFGGAQFGGGKFGDGALAALRLLGQAPFSAQSPAGWPDTADSWIAPEAMITRVQWAFAAGQTLAGQVDARGLARASIGPVASEGTMFHIDTAPSPAEAIALLIASPEFQRR